MTYDMLKEYEQYVMRQKMCGCRAISFIQWCNSKGNTW